MSTLSHLLLARLQHHTEKLFMQQLVNAKLVASHQKHIDGLSVSVLHPKFDSTQITGDIVHDIQRLKQMHSVLRGPSASSRQDSLPQKSSIASEVSPELADHQGDTAKDHGNLGGRGFGHQPDAQPGSTKRQSRGKIRQREDYAVRLLRSLAPAPSIAMLTAVLMIGRALDTSPADQTLAILRKQDNTVAILTHVIGFERTCAELLAAGVLTRAPLAIADQMNRYFGEPLIGFSEEQDEALLANPDLLKIARFDGSWVGSNRTRLVQGLISSIRQRLASVIVSENGMSLPRAVIASADMCLNIPRIDRPLLIRALCLHLGLDFQTHKAEIYDQIAKAGLWPQWLSLDDLSLGIRPGRSVGDSIASLKALADLRADEATDLDTDDITEEILADIATGGQENQRSTTVGKATTASEHSEPDPEDLDQASESAIADVLEDPSLKTAQKKKVAKPEQKSDSKPDDRQVKGRGKKWGSGSVIITPESPVTKPAEGKAPDPKPPLTVETLTGYGQANEWALNLKVDLDLYNQNEVHWADLSTKLLLSGAPGTGKTTFARALCNTLQLPLYVSSVATWLQCSHLGDVISRMVEVFAEVESARPAILLIDEFDTIGKRQDSNREYSDYWNTLVAKLLELLDGAVKSEGIIIIGACNHPENIDEALVRSGRLENHIVIPRPDTNALVGIIGHHLGSDIKTLLTNALAKIAIDRQNSPDNPGSQINEQPLASQLTEPEILRNLALKATGRTGADIERIIREARQKARRARAPLTYDLLEAAFLGNRRKRTYKQRRTTAVHEAGHVMVAHALKVGHIKMVTIENNDGGYMELEPDIAEMQTEPGIERFMSMLLAGRTAEMQLLGSSSIGAGGTPDSDLARATIMATSLESSFGFGKIRPLLYTSPENAVRNLHHLHPLAEGINARLQAAEIRAKDIIDQHRETIQKLAQRLLEKDTIEHDEIMEMLSKLD